MKVEFLLSFKNHEQVLDLDDDFLKLISENFTKHYSKKAKKKNIKPILKCNLLKNLKLQKDKNKTEYKANLLMNKLSKNNFEDIIKEFIITFPDIDQNDFDIILETLFTKMIKDDKFIGLFFKFYNQIYTIYNNLFELSNEHFINLVEEKVRFNYSSYQLKKESSFIQELNTEENRINSLRLVIFLLENNNFHKKIINIVSEFLVESNYIPDIYFWFSNKYIMENIKLDDYNNQLKNKLSDDINHRYIILLKNLLDKNNIDYNELETEDDSECCLEIETNTEKTEFEIEIENILEEYLLLGEFDEVMMFLDPFKSEDKTVKVFMYSLLNFYFNSNLSNLGKFKSLFINLKKSKIIKSDVFKTSLTDLLSNEENYDYTNLSNKVEKIIEIYKIIQVRISKDFANNLRNLVETV